MPIVYLYALGANLSFSLGSQAFTYFSRRFSPQWMNALKGSVAFLCFTTWVLISGGPNSIGPLGIGAFVLSGMIGLAVGDIFLLGAFKEMGPGRTMLLFGFQPLIVGTLSYFAFGQTVDVHKLWAILFFIFCVVIISLESFRGMGHWQLRGIMKAGAGMALDAVGIIITRATFDAHPQISAMEGNMYRCFGAVVFFCIYAQFLPLGLFSGLKSLERKHLALALIGPVFGTFVSLGLYLKAMQTANLAGLTGLAITGTVFSSLFECLIARRWPSKYFYAAFVSFLVGMKFLLF